LDKTRKMTIQKLIEKYKNQVVQIDESIAEIKDLSTKGRQGVISYDMDDLKRRISDANFCTLIHMQSIKDFKSAQDLKLSL